jgi:hypothetical protein
MGRRMNCSWKQLIGGVPAQCPSPTAEGAVCFWLAPFPLLNYFSLRSIPEDEADGPQYWYSVPWKLQYPCHTGTVFCVRQVLLVQCTVCQVIPLHRAVMSWMCIAQLRLGRTPRGALPAPTQTIVIQSSVTFLSLYIPWYAADFSITDDIFCASLCVQFRRLTGCHWRWKYPFFARCMDGFLISITLYSHCTFNI